MNYREGQGLLFKLAGLFIVIIDLWTLILDFFTLKVKSALISLHYTYWMKWQYHNMYCHNCLSRELKSILGINEQYSSTKLICKCMICKHCAKMQ